MKPNAPPLRWGPILLLTTLLHASGGIGSANAQCGYGSKFHALDFAETNRLTFWLKRDERAARRLRAQAERHLVEAMKFVNGSRSVRSHAGFKAVVGRFLSSPAQQRLLRIKVPFLGTDEFEATARYQLPTFSGGTFGELLYFVGSNKIPVRQGGLAHHLLTEFFYDHFDQTDARLARLEGRIELYKAQSRAHNAALYSSCVYCQGYPYFHPHSGSCSHHSPSEVPAGFASSAYGPDNLRRNASRPAKRPKTNPVRMKEVEAIRQLVQIGKRDDIPTAKQGEELSLVQRLLR